MADVFFKAHIDGVDYELPKLDLEGCRIMKERFGLKGILNWDQEDPDHLAGVMYLSLRHAGVDDQTALAQVHALDILDVIKMLTEPAPEAEPPDDEAKEESPTVAAPASGKKQRAASKKATTPKTPGPQPSESA